MKPTRCIFCGAERVYPDDRGTQWEDRCRGCGWHQVAGGWFRQMEQVGLETELTLQCPFLQRGRRCEQAHTFSVAQLLGESYEAQFRCPRCDTWGTGKELMHNNTAFLRWLILDTVEVQDAVWERCGGEM